MTNDKRKFRVIKPTGKFAIQEKEIFIDSSCKQINLENPKDKTPVYFVENKTEDDFYFVDKNNEIIVFSNDGKSCKRLGVSQFEKTGLKVGDIISLDKKMDLLDQVSLCVDSFLQEITPRTKAEEILNILNISYDKPDLGTYNVGEINKYLICTDFENGKYIEITKSQYKDIKKLYINVPLKAKDLEKGKKYKVLSKISGNEKVIEITGKNIIDSSLVIDEFSFPTFERFDECNEVLEEVEND